MCEFFIHKALFLSTYLFLLLKNIHHSCLVNIPHILAQITEKTDSNILSNLSFEKYLKYIYKIEISLTVIIESISSRYLNKNEIWNHHSLF